MLPKLVYLKPEKISSWEIQKKYGFAEGEDQAMYMNPCLPFLGEKAIEFVNQLPQEQRATPGRYFIKETREVETVRLFNKKCPDGFEQNVKRSLCEARPGIDPREVCSKKSPLTGRSMIEMLQLHIENLQGS